MIEHMSLQTVSQSLYGGFLCVDESWVIDQSNKVIGDWFPQQKTMVGRECFSVLFHRDKPCEDCPLYSHHKEGVKREEIHRASPYNSLYLEVSCYSLWDLEKRDRLGALSFVWDITEEKREGDSLKKKEEQLFLTMESMFDGLIATNREGFIFRMNSKAQELTGWSFEEVEGEKIESILKIDNISTEESFEDFVESVLEIDKTNYLFNTTTLKRKDGKEVPITLTVTPIIERDGEIEGVILHLSYQTKMHETREALQKSEKEKALILNSISESCVLYDVEKRIMWMNKKAEELAGCKGSEVIGSPCYSIWF